MSEIERSNWKVIYIDANGEELSHIILYDMGKDEAELRGAVNIPNDRAIDDYRVELLNK